MLSQSLAETGTSKKVSGTCWKETLVNMKGFFLENEGKEGW